MKKKLNKTEKRELDFRLNRLTEINYLYNVVNRDLQTYLQLLGREHGFKKPVKLNPDDFNEIMEVETQDSKKKDSKSGK